MEVVRRAPAVGRMVATPVVVVPPLASRRAAAPAPVPMLGARKVVPGRLAPLSVPAVKPEAERVVDSMSLHARLVCMGRVSVGERLSQ